MNNLQDTKKSQPEPMRLRRGDILRSIETDELCTVWSTSTTGKTLIKWGDNDFCEYTAEQIGELFWLEPLPDDLELSAEKSDNYAAFHAGYRFAVAHSLAQPEQEPVAWMYPDALCDRSCLYLCTKAFTQFPECATTPPQRKPLTNEQKSALCKQFPDHLTYNAIHAIEAAHGIKE